LDWITVLKAGIGSWVDIAKGRQPMPSKEDIEGLDEKAKSKKYNELDTVITNMKNDLKNLPKEKPDFLEGIVQQLFWGTRRVKKLSRPKIEERLSELQERKIWFGMENPLYSQKFKTSEEAEPTTFGEFVSPEDKTDKEWATEVLQLLHDNFVKEQSNYSGMALYLFIKELQGEGSRGGATGGGGSISWKRDPINLIEVSDKITPALRKLQNMSASEMPPDATNKLVSAFGKKRGVAAPRHDTKIEHKVEGRKGTLRTKKDKETGEEYDVRETTRRVRGKRGVTIGDNPYDIALVHPQLPITLSSMQLAPFKKLVDLLHKSGVTKDTVLAPFKGTSINLLHDIAITPAGGITLNNAMKKIDMGRKGITPRHRQSSLKHLFALYYLRKQLRINKRKFSIGPYDLMPDSITLKEEEELVNEETKIKVIAYIKRVMKSERSPTIMEAWKEFVRKTPLTSDKTKEVIDKMKEEKRRKGNISPALKEEYDKIVDAAELGSLGAKHLQTYLGSDIDYDTIIESYNIQGLWKKTMFAWIYSCYVESDTEEEFDNKLKQFISAGKNVSWGQGFIDRLPQGELFIGNDKQSFIDSMIVILTIVKKFHGQDALKPFDDNLLDISDTYYQNVTNVLDELAEDEGVDLDEERDFLLTLLYDKDLVTEVDPEMSNALGIKGELDILYNTINELVFDLGEKVISIIMELVKRIAEDDTGKYTKARLKLKGQKATIREHLVKLKLLKWPKSQDEEE
jgi:hypothetical protein